VRARAASPPSGSEARAGPPGGCSLAFRSFIAAMATITTPRSAFLHGQWTVDDAARLYGLADWGKGYFGVNAQGHLTVMPTKEPGKQIDLHEVVTGLKERGIHTPVLLRFN